MPGPQTVAKVARSKPTKPKEDEDQEDGAPDYMKDSDDETTPKPAAAKKKGKKAEPAKKRKAKDEEDEEEEDAEAEEKPAKKKSSAAPPAKKTKKSVDEDAGAEEEEEDGSGDQKSVKAKPTTTKKAKPSKAVAAAASAAEASGEDEEETTKPPPKKKKVAAKPKQKEESGDDADEEEEEETAPKKPVKKPAEASVAAVATEGKKKPESAQKTFESALLEPMFKQFAADGAKLMDRPRFALNHSMVNAKNEASLNVYVIAFDPRKTKEFTKNGLGLKPHVRLWEVFHTLYQKPLEESIALAKRMYGRNEDAANKIVQEMEEKKEQKKAAASEKKAKKGGSDDEAPAAKKKKATPAKKTAARAEFDGLSPSKFVFGVLETRTGERVLDVFLSLASLSELMATPALYGFPLTKMPVSTMILASQQFIDSYLKGVEVATAAGKEAEFAKVVMPSEFLLEHHPAGVDLKVIIARQSMNVTWMVQESTTPFAADRFNPKKTFVLNKDVANLSNDREKMFALATQKPAEKADAKTTNKKPAAAANGASKNPEEPVSKVDKSDKPAVAEAAMAAATTITETTVSKKKVESEVVATVDDTTASDAPMAAKPAAKAAAPEEEDPMVM